MEIVGLLPVQLTRAAEEALAGQEVETKVEISPRWHQPSSISVTVPEISGREGPMLSPLGSAGFHCRLGSFWQGLI